MVEKCLRNNPKYNTFEIINVAGDGEKRIDEVKNKINKTNKSITISCKRFDTGSTVKQWDYVMMLSNIKSAESYWQTAFRPGTPWEEGDKRKIFVFDWDYNRVLQVVGDYAKALEDYSDKSMGEIVREMLETMPIHSLCDAIPCKIDVEDVLNHYHEDRSTNFESAHLFDESNINQTICDILIGREEIKSFSQKQKLDEESESNGKTYKIEKENKTIKKENNDWIAKARSITVLLPHIIQQEENIKSLNDFNENSNLFYNVTKITLEQFKILIEFGFIDGDLIDDTIRSVSHQMHHM
jgi:type I site-specific restriction endonuclease